MDFAIDFTLSTDTVDGIKNEWQEIKTTGKATIEELKDCLLTAYALYAPIAYWMFIGLGIAITFVVWVFQATPVTANVALQPTYSDTVDANESTAKKTTKKATKKTTKPNLTIVKAENVQGMKRDDLRKLATRLGFTRTEVRKPVSQLRELVQAKLAQNNAA